jgi:hypothetical protein
LHCLRRRLLVPGSHFLRRILPLLETLGSSQVKLITYFFVAMELNTQMKLDDFARISDNSAIEEVLRVAAFALPS